MLCSGLNTDRRVRPARIVWGLTCLPPDLRAPDYRDRVGELLGSFLAGSGLLGPDDKLDPADLLLLPGPVDRDSVAGWLRVSVERVGQLSVAVSRCVGRPSEVSEEGWLEHTADMWSHILRKSSIVSDYCNRL